MYKQTPHTVYFCECSRVTKTTKRVHFDENQEVDLKSITNLVSLTAINT